MANDVMMVLLEATIASTLAILLVAALRGPLRRHLGAAAAHALWSGQMRALSDQRQVRVHRRTSLQLQRSQAHVGGDLVEATCGGILIHLLRGL